MGDDMKRLWDFVIQQQERVEELERQMERIRLSHKNYVDKKQTDESSKHLWGGKKRR